MLADLQQKSERAAADEIRQAAPRPRRALLSDTLHTASEPYASDSLLILSVRRRKATE